MMQAIPPEIYLSFLIAIFSITFLGLLSLMFTFLYKIRLRDRFGRTMILIVKMCFDLSSLILQAFIYLEKISINAGKLVNSG